MKLQARKSGGKARTSFSLDRKMKNLCESNS